MEIGHDGDVDILGRANHRHLLVHLSYDISSLGILSTFVLVAEHVFYGNGTSRSWPKRTGQEALCLLAKRRVWVSLSSLCGVGVGVVGASGGSSQVVFG
jgi:hypothetical protein